ncbi:MAG: glycosyltransferase family 2 protein [Spirochaetales bacterium]|nr:glycosyltransferase family 2 protein [Spirochaetales bacterium]
MKKRVSAVIVNYKTPRLVVDCLDSIQENPDETIDLKVYIVDNQSGDDSSEVIGAYIGEGDRSSWISYIQAERNGGFSYGNNVGFRAILEEKDDPDYVWMLNSDTLVRKGACAELVDFMDSHPQAGIGGSRLEDPDGTAQISAFRDFSPLSEMLAGYRLSLLSKIFSRHIVAPEEISSTPVQADWVAGASLMIRTEVLKNFGLFDENYFLYFEEVDFCLNVRRSGRECWYVPQSRVVHLVGASTGISDLRKRAPRRPVYWFESRNYFFLKNYGRGKLFLANYLFLTGYLTFRLRKILSKETRLEPPRFVRDFLLQSPLLKRKKK